MTVVHTPIGAQIFAVEQRVAKGTLIIIYVLRDWLPFNCDIISPHHITVC